jgi:hypothetical protein
MKNDPKLHLKMKCNFGEGEMRGKERGGREEKGENLLP